MTTPVHPSTSTGTRGELKAAVIFSDIGWAPPAKLSEDIGTDFLTFARSPAAPEQSAKAWDLGAPVVLQIKGSDSEYSAPSDDLDGQAGWWFGETETYHFDHWLSFGLPYLLVLVDVPSQTAYWAKVDGDAIVSTGKGQKIFVPASQTVDMDHVEELNKVAVSRRRYALEGAVWDGALRGLGPADRLRHALLVPRLVAPHPNRTTTTLTYEEATAMVLRNRYFQLVHPDGKGAKWPAPSEWGTHRDWGWRFADAVYRLFSTGDAAPLIELEKTAKRRHRFERDACLVVLAAVAHADGDTKAALEFLTPGRATKPADLGWLLVHRAALLLELDRPEEAAAAARKALVALSALDGDVTVSLIRGGAASVLYSVAGFGSDLAPTITAQDNAGTWWRAQDVSWALEKDLNLRFEGWAGSSTVHVVGGTAALADLVVAGWTAAFSGTWASWRHLQAMTARLVFTGSRDPAALQEALLTLIQVGEKKAAKNAANKMWRDGPIGPLQETVRLLAERPWNKRDEGPTMAVLAAAGDLLPPSQADHIVARILEVLEVDGEVRVHASGWTDRWHEISDTLPPVLEAATVRSHRKVADLVIKTFASCDDATAHWLVRLANALNVPDLGVRRLSQLVKAAADRDDSYSVDLLGSTAAHSQAAAAALRARAQDGNDRAMRALLVAGSRERDDFIAFGRSTVRTVRRMVENARGKDGVITTSGFVNDQLDDLVLAALNSHDTRLWKEVTDTLEAGLIEETQQQRALRRLAHHFDDLPVHVRRKLRKLAPNLRGYRAGVHFGGAVHNDFAAAALHLRIAAGLVPHEQVELLLLEELRRDPVGLVTTLGAWNSPGKLPFLMTMLVNEHPTVRAHAAHYVVRHAHSFPADADRALAVLRTTLAQDGGCALSDGAAQGLAAYPDVAPGELLDGLHKHPSAKVRKRFAD